MLQITRLIRFLSQMNRYENGLSAIQIIGFYVNYRKQFQFVNYITNKFICFII